MPTSIQALYDHHRVPPNLQRHMLRVAAVATMVLDDWTGPPLARKRLVTVLLLHDVGNIVKCDYDRMPHMLEEEQHRAGYWKQVQAEVRTRYGDDEREVTQSICREAGFETAEFELLAGMDFWNNHRTAEGEDMTTKLAAYADQRVAPFGIVSVTERFAEARRRYAQAPSSAMASARSDRMIACAHTIETQLFAHCRSAPGALDDRRAAPLVEALRAFIL